MGGDQQERQDQQAGPVADAFVYCRTFRRLAKRVRGLDPLDPDGEGQKDRIAALEELWELGAGLDVWWGGSAHSLGLAMLCVYQGRDAEAAGFLDQLADNELEVLRGEEDDSGAE